MELKAHSHLGKVFISHTAIDKRFVRRLRTRLEAAGYKVWLDEHEILAGDPLAEQIGEALKQAKVVLVVVSKASVASRWLRYELNIATQHEAERSLAEQSFHRVDRLLKPVQIVLDVVHPKRRVSAFEVPVTMATNSVSISLSSWICPVCQRTRSEFG